MKHITKLLALVAMTGFSALSSTIHAQEQSDYFYLGYTFEQNEGVKSPSPYLTVALFGSDEEVPKAVAMSNGISDVSFEGIPFDLHVKNKLKVYAGNRLVGVYLPPSWPEGKEPSFPSGNINAHMEVPHLTDFYTIHELTLPGESDVLFRDFLKEVPLLEVDGDTFFAKGQDSSLKIFVNGVSLPAEKLNVLLDKLPVKYVKQCRLVLYNEPNLYFSGAIDITLTIGNPECFPTDTQYLISIPLSK